MNYYKNITTIEHLNRKITKLYKVFFVSINIIKRFFEVKNKPVQAFLNIKISSLNLLKEKNNIRSFC